MADEAVLYYFDGRGRAEIIRMLLCASNIKFREVHLTEREQIVKLIEDGELLFNQVPLLKIDGINIVQTNAITNYISGQAGLNGKDATEKAWIDMYFEGSRDLYGPFLGMLFVGTVQDTLTTVEVGLTRYLPIFNNALGKNASSFLVGSTMTRADIGLLEPLLAITEYFGEEKLDPYPHLKIFLSKMCSMNSISHYLNNLRKRQNDEKYISTVKKVLAK